MRGDLHHLVNAPACDSRAALRHMRELMNRGVRGALGVDGELKVGERIHQCVSQPC